MHTNGLRGAELSGQGTLLGGDRTRREPRELGRSGWRKTLASWFAFALMVSALLWLDVRVGILAGLAGLVAAWLRQQRVPAAHVAETSFYHRTLVGRTRSEGTARSARQAADSQHR